MYRLLPDWVPFHPHKWWIHVRTVYVPMCYLYGIQYKAEENDLIRSLREVCALLIATASSLIQASGTIYRELL